MIDLNRRGRSDRFESKSNRPTHDDPTAKATNKHHQHRSRVSVYSLVLFWGLPCDPRRQTHSSSKDSSFVSRFLGLGSCHVCQCTALHLSSLQSLQSFHAGARSSRGRPRPCLAAAPLNHTAPFPPTSRPSHLEGEEKKGGKVRPHLTRTDRQETFTTIQHPQNSGREPLASPSRPPLPSLVSFCSCVAAREAPFVRSSTRIDFAL